MQPAMVLEGGLSDPVAVARRLADKRVQEHLDARVGANLVQRALHGFRIENHENAAMPDRRRDSAEAPQLAEQLAGYSSDRLACLFAERVETAVGEHVADRRRPAEASRLLDQGRTGAAPSRGRSRRHTRTPASDHDDVEMITRAQLRPRFAASRPAREEASKIPASSGILLKAGSVFRRARQDHPGNLSPNIGRPLTDASFVTSSWMTSQCSASWPFSRRTISTTIQFAGRPKPLNRPWRST